MENLRHLYTKEDRAHAQQDIVELRPYLLYCLKQRSNDTCELCGHHADNYDIHHVVYNPAITINELQLLCVPCHASITDY
jgi:hypothetical protein